MNRKMIRLALAGKWGCLGARGDSPCIRAVRFGGGLLLKQCVQRERTEAARRRAQEAPSPSGSLMIEMDHEWWSRRDLFPEEEVVGSQHGVT